MKGNKCGNVLWCSYTDGELVEDAVTSWWGDIVGHFSLIRNELKKFVEPKFLHFWCSVLTLLMSVRYFDNELYNRSPNTVIAFSWRDCAGFLFVNWILNNALCSMSWMFSGFYFVSRCTIDIWHHMLCYLTNIYTVYSK